MVKSLLDYLFNFEIQKFHVHVRLVFSCWVTYGVVIIGVDGLYSSCGVLACEKSFILVLRSYVTTKLFVLQAIGDCGQGFCNFIIFFVFQPQLRQLLINGCQRFCCICCSKASQWWRGLHNKRDIPHESDELVQPLDRTSTVPTEFSQYTLYV